MVPSLPFLLASSSEITESLFGNQLFRFSNDEVSFQYLLTEHSYVCSYIKHGSILKTFTQTTKFHFLKLHTAALAIV